MRTNLKYMFYKYSFLPKRLVDFISINLNQYSINDFIIIAGGPRTGTTWIMEILQNLKGYKTLFEPLHRNRFFLPIGFPPRLYLHPKTSHPALWQHLNDVFNGNVVSRMPHYQFSIKDVINRLSSCNLVIKIINGNRLLPWILRMFNPRSTFLILRHPCATIASQIKSGWIGYPRELELKFRENNIEIIKKTILKGASTILVDLEKEKILKRIGRLGSMLELLAVEWSLDYYIPLYYRDNLSVKWIVYEKLVKEEKKIFNDIFHEIGKYPTNNMKIKFKRPSSTASAEKIRTERQLTNWKKYLTERQIEKILNVIKWFDINFYTDQPEPRYELINNTINNI